MSEKKNGFRSDIAALRAVAVLLVMLCHFGIPGFNFGFIGVDIFFVISGYLISRILYKEYLSSSPGKLKNSSLSLSTFYLRRVRRLLPAAVIVIVAVNIMSFFIYGAETRNNLLGSSKWALFFLANVSFLRTESDYFQQGNEPSFLQHYWSLSVEEQFYFIWPLLFLIAAHFQKFKLRNKFIRFNFRIISLMSLVSVASFIFLQYEFSQNPLQAYFSIFTRAWELGIGSIFGILAFHKRRNSVYSHLERFLPLALAIVTSFFFISEKNWANFLWLPVIGTGLFLYTGQTSSISETEQSKFIKVILQPVLFTGKISYSLYLVHWPILILANRTKITEIFGGTFALFPLSYCFAYLLWRYIEIPFQKIKLPKKSINDERIFLFFKARLGSILCLIFLIIGSLYAVTYPQVSSKLIFSDSTLNNLTTDPNLQKYANYQDQIVSHSSSLGNENLTQLETGTGIIQQSLPELITNLKNEVAKGLEIKNLSSSQQVRFAKIGTDQNDYEKSPCPSDSVAIPPNCSIANDPSITKKVALVGDSKMAMLAKPLMKYFQTKGWKVDPMAMYGCHMSNPNNTLAKKCIERTDWVLKELSANRYDVVVFAEYPDGNTISKQKQFFSSISSSSEKLIILTQTPQLLKPLNCIDPVLPIPVDCMKIPKVLKTDWEKSINFLHTLNSSKVSVVDSHLWWSKDASIPVIINDIFTQRDGNHLTDSFVNFITPTIYKTLDSIILNGN